MQKKHHVLLLLSGLFMSTAAHAQLVSVQVFDILNAVSCESDVQEEYPAIEHSVLWENGVMNTLFDAGYIVSNMPVSRIAQALVPPASLEEAQDAGIDILICLYLAYDLCAPSGQVRGPAALRPAALSWEVRYPARAGQGQGVQEWMLEPSRTDKETVRQAEALGRTIISGLNGR